MASRDCAVLNWLAATVRCLRDRVDVLETNVNPTSLKRERVATAIRLADLVPKGHTFNVHAQDFFPLSWAQAEWEPFEFHSTSFKFTLDGQDVGQGVGPRAKAHPQLEAEDEIIQHVCLNQIGPEPKISQSTFILPEDPTLHTNMRALPAEDGDKIYDRFTAPWPDQMLPTSKREGSSDWSIPMIDKGNNVTCVDPFKLASGITSFAKESRVARASIEPEDSVAYTMEQIGEIVRVATEEGAKATATVFKEQICELTSENELLKQMFLRPPREEAIATQVSLNSTMDERIKDAPAETTTGIWNTSCDLRTLPPDSWKRMHDSFSRPDLSTSPMPRNLNDMSMTAFLAIAAGVRARIPHLMSDESHIWSEGSPMLHLEDISIADCLSVESLRNKEQSVADKMKEKGIKESFGAVSTLTAEIISRVRNCKDYFKYIRNGALDLDSGHSALDIDTLKERCVEHPRFLRRALQVVDVRYHITTNVDELFCLRLAREGIMEAIEDNPMKQEYQRNGF